MIIQISKLDLKMKLRPGITLEVLRKGNDENLFRHDRIKVSAKGKVSSKEIAVDMSPEDTLRMALSDRKNNFYEVVDKVHEIFLFKPLDDNGADFQQDLIRLYYLIYTKEAHDTLLSIVSLFKREHETAQGVIERMLDESLVD